MIQFAWPYLFLLIPLPWLVHRFFPQSQWNDNAALRVPDLSEFGCFERPCSPSFFKWTAFFAFLIWLALLASAARPQWLGKPLKFLKAAAI